MLRASSVPVARRRASAATGAAFVLLAVLTGCTGVPGPGASTTAPPPSGAVSAPPTPAEPQLVPEGDGTDNLPLFAAVTARVWASADRAEGRAYVDALVSAGFPKERMQVTADRSTVGNPAESIQFSVAWGESDCLIGQVGPSTGEPVTSVMAQLADGRCLVGATRDIDW
ncbi:DUF6993 domain-containing protein [Microbacterium sp. NPDC058342]|uniref:DUF6993 domain-containing protein n=1 Tax=Microbacterium sp. NPDC058342 TaxID=3346454 RepID=UPI003666613E